MAARRTSSMPQNNHSPRLFAAVLSVAALLAPRAGSAQPMPPAPSPTPTQPPATPAPQPQAPPAPVTAAPTPPSGTTEPDTTGPSAGPGQATRKGTDDPVGKKVPAREPEHVPTLNIEGLIGGAARLNGSSTGYSFSERGGVGYQLSLSWTPSKRFSVGLGYLHSGVGVEEGQTASGFTGIQTRRVLDAALLDLRLFPVRGETVSFFVGLLGGVGFEGVDQRGSVVSQSFAQPKIDTFSCQARGGAGLGLGGAMGLDIDMGGGASFLVRAAALTFALPSKTLSDGDTPCASGAGTTNSFQGQVGLQYSFDLAPRAASPAGPTTAAH
jgi:hypothetical protein